MKLLVVAAMSTAVLAPGAAQAEDFSRVDALAMPTTRHGLSETAKPQAPTWCKHVEGADERGRDANAWRRTIEAGFKDAKVMVHAAAMACLFEADPGAQRGVQLILQQWMNWTGQTQASAVESLTLRVQKGKFEADREKLCKELVVSDELGGEEKHFLLARQTLFCSPRETPQWDAQNKRVSNELAAVLDMSATPPDELVRLASVISNNSYLLQGNSDFFTKNLVSYFAEQIDLAAISTANLTRALAVAPYAGNSYARAVGIESESYAQMLARGIQKEVDARTAKDADWKMLLVTAPTEAVATWTAMASKYKDQLARSNEFEKNYFGASKKAVAGCWEPLRKDFIDVLSEQNHANENLLKTALNNPIVSLLFSRVAACASVEQDALYAASLRAAVSDVRYARGPRTAAYYGALEAFGPIKADRAKFPVDVEAFQRPTDVSLMDRALEYTSRRKSEINTQGWVGGEGAGTVKTVKPHAKGIEVTFATTIQDIMQYECKPTNRISQIRADGSVVYQDSCRETGFVKVNTTPLPIVLPSAAWAENIKPGAVMSFEATPSYQEKWRFARPTFVYADKTKKKLVNYLGFGLGSGGK